MTVVGTIGPNRVVERVGSIAGVETGVERANVARVIAVDVGLLLVQVEGDANLSHDGRELAEGGKTVGAEHAELVAHAATDGRFAHFDAEEDRGVLAVGRREEERG